MIKANHHRFYEWFFDMYIGSKMRSQFHAHRIGGDTVLSGGSILMIGNHFGWWDGFWLRRANQRTYKRRFHIMMLEEQLKDRLFLSKLGAFSLKKNHRDMLNTMHYAISLLKDENNLVLLFPQGRFQSLHQHPVTFEKGWFRILQQAPAHTRLVFMANLTDYFEHPRPTLTTRLKVVDKSFGDASEVEEAYNAFLLDAIQQQNPYQ